MVNKNTVTHTYWMIWGNKNIYIYICISFDLVSTGGQSVWSSNFAFVCRVLCSVAVQEWDWDGHSILLSEQLWLTVWHKNIYVCKVLCSAWYSVDGYCCTRVGSGNWEGYAILLSEQLWLTPIHLFAPTPPQISPTPHHSCYGSAAFAFDLACWNRFYESSQAMPTYRSYFDQRFNDTYVGFMKRHSDYHVTIQHRVDPIRWTRAWRWRNGKVDCFKITR